jgi:hypothetical protein
MSETVRRIARSQPIPWRRMVFGLLLVVTVVVPIALGIVAAGGHVDAGALRSLIILWMLAGTGLLVWSAVYVKDEPILVRTAVSLLAVFFLIAALRTQFSATTQANSAGKPSQQTTPHEIGPATKIDKKKSLAETLIGKWKLANHSQTMEFRSGENKFFVTTDAGQALEFGYKVHDENHLDVWLPLMPPDADPVSWAFTLADENELTVQTKPNAKPVSYTRAQ